MRMHFIGEDKLRTCWVEWLWSWSTSLRLRTKCSALDFGSLLLMWLSRLVILSLPPSELCLRPVLQPLLRATLPDILLISWSDPGEISTSVCTEGIYHIKEKLIRILEKLAGKKKKKSKRREENGNVHLQMDLKLRWGEMRRQKK